MYLVIGLFILQDPVLVSLSGNFILSSVQHSHHYILIYLFTDPFLPLPLDWTCCFRAGQRKFSCCVQSYLIECTHTQRKCHADCMNLKLCVWWYVFSIFQIKQINQTIKHLSDKELNFSVLHSLIIAVLIDSVFLWVRSASFVFAHKDLVMFIFHP